jgi:hypothetical protein
VIADFLNGLFAAGGAAQPPSSILLP